MTTDEKYGCYAFDRPHCSECGKEFLVIPYHIVIDVKDKVIQNLNDDSVS
ncbi:hypothetical protein [Paenibacillus aceris]|uniref:Uncharacterized protein n=1 Tax=Paenibacillus aceris TaxID=869555 RepID=A0ABS4I8A8_9BACL|nr:hypothetical protein [Paenibacillus aceris]MBP1967138.1 hypothetical protein [Paenibacillus aceris]